MVTGSGGGQAPQLSRCPRPPPPNTCPAWLAVARGSLVALLAGGGEREGAAH